MIFGLNRDCIGENIHLINGAATALASRPYTFHYIQGAVGHDWIRFRLLLTMSTYFLLVPCPSFPMQYPFSSSAISTCGTIPSGASCQQQRGDEWEVFGPNGSGESSVSVSDIL